VTVEYSGRARIGSDERAPERQVRIVDVEAPAWIGVLVACEAGALPVGEQVVTLLDEGIYERWSGTARFAYGRGRDAAILGRTPLVPPAST
jgi:hypothetical protein